MTKINLNGQEFDLDAVVNLMDDETREKVCELAPESDQEFVNLYAKMHADKFGEQFVVN